MHKLEVIVTPSAEVDLQNIFDYIAADNLNKAIEMIDIFEEKFNTIATFPNIGFKKSKFVNRDVKEYVVLKHYEIIYSVKGEILFIHRVLTGYQNIFEI